MSKKDFVLARCIGGLFDGNVCHVVKDFDRIFDFRETTVSAAVLPVTENSATTTEIQMDSYRLQCVVPPRPGQFEIIVLAPKDWTFEEMFNHLVARAYLK